jgi:transcriptional regulator with XRE-family HTH domain
MAIGDQIIHLREKGEISRENLAKSLGISYWALSKYETNVRTPDPETMGVIADYFGVSVDYLHGRSEVDGILNVWRQRIRNGERIVLKDVVLTEEHIDKMENALKEKDDK